MSDSTLSQTLDDTLDMPAPGGAQQSSIKNPHWSIREIIREAWNLQSGAKLPIWGAVILSYFATFAVAFLMGFIAGLIPGVPGMEILAQVVIALVTWPLWAGLSMMGIRRAGNLPIRASLVFEYYDRIIAIFLLYLAIVISIMLGYVLLIIPGIYLSVAYALALPLVVEKNLGVWEAMETSRRAITKCWFRTFGLFLVMGLIMLAGLIPLGIGLIWAVPMMVVMMGILYRELFGIEPTTQQAQ